MAANSNRSALQAEANDYPNIRFFSVGHRTSSPTPLRDLQSVWEPWQVASNLTIVQVRPVVYRTLTNAAQLST